MLNWSGWNLNQTMNILFLCTGNSCRSILTEATFNHLAPPNWRAMSVGNIVNRSKVWYERA